MSRRVRPIRLDRQSVLSIEALPKIEFSAQSCGMHPVDWESALPAVGFDVDETQFLLRTRIDGFTHSQAAAEMGWNPTKMERIKKRVNRKLADGPFLTDVPILFRASGVAYLEKLPSGHQAWTLTPANPAEPGLMRRERTIFFSKSTTYKNV